MNIAELSKAVADRTDLSAADVRVVLSVAFDEIASGVDARRFATQPSWLSCRVEDDVWHGAGDAAKLEVILDTFLDWAELHGAD